MKSAHVSQITAKHAGYDSDDERDNAHQMFIDDIQHLRQSFMKGIEEQIII